MDISNKLPERLRPIDSDELLAFFRSDLPIPASGHGVSLICAIILRASK
jgi:hypothetical protein